MRKLLAGGAVTVALVAAGCGGHSIPVASPKYPVECARGPHMFRHCYQLGRHVRLAIMGYGATCDPSDASLGWHFVGGPGEPTRLGSTTLACESPQEASAH